MAESRKISLYEWIQAALEIAEPCCEIHKRTKLQLVYITDEEGDLITWYLECPRPKCNREYSFLMSFYPIVVPDEV